MADSCGMTGADRLIPMMSMLHGYTGIYTIDKCRGGLWDMNGILVIDDSTDSRMRVVKTLKAYGYHIDTLADARYADQMISSAAPDLVLINRQPLSFDSISLFLRIREMYPETAVMLYALKSETAVNSLNQAVSMAFKERRAVAG